MLFWWATLNSKFTLWFNNGFKICKLQNNKTLNLDWLFYEKTAATSFATRVFRPRLCWNFRDILAGSRPRQNTAGTKHKNPQTSGAMRNNESTTTEPSPWNVQQLKPQGLILPWILLLSKHNICLTLVCPIILIMQHWFETHIQIIQLYRDGSSWVEPVLS